MSGNGSGSIGGTYSLVIELSEPALLPVGALGEQHFPAGAYAYTGSALGTGGFSRVDRHRRTAAGDHDVRHWHVDYLLGHPAARIVDVVRTVGIDVECLVAERLPDGPVDGFGSSDCTCRSHLSMGVDDCVDVDTDTETDSHSMKADALSMETDALTNRLERVHRSASSTHRTS